MNCTSPVLALRLYRPFQGKQAIKILPVRPDTGLKQYVDRYGEKNILQLPCGHCASCLLNKRKEWALRCCLEAKDHDQNCFVTLTYDPKHYPGEPRKDHLQKFLKEIRRKYKIRYYGCSEQGDEFGRWHYHIILFGFFPSDAKPWAKSQSGYMQFRSNFLDDCWEHKGLVVVAQFHPFNAQYVAGYVVKKMINGDSSFHIQSTKPGIGAGYFFRNAQDIYETDNIIANFGNGVFKVPRYFDKLAEILDIDLSGVKEKRLVRGKIASSKQIREHGFVCEDQLLDYNNKVVSSNIKRKKRRF